MDKKLQHARTIANLMDRQFKIGGIEFGIESFLGFIPFLGDILGLLLSLYIYRIGHGMGLLRRHKIIMIFNIILDMTVGFIPFLGDIFDVAYKANVRNLHILEKYARGKVIDGEIVK